RRPIDAIRMTRRQLLRAMLRAQLHEHPVFGIERREHGCEVDEHLGLAEYEKGAVAQRIVETLDDTSLRLAVKVHQRVAAQEQIDARNRSVAEQVVATEDNASAKVLGEYPLVAD